MSSFYKLQPETSNFIQEVWTKNDCSNNLKLDTIGNSKLKTLIKLNKVNDLMKNFVDVDIVAEVNEEMFSLLDSDEVRTILLYQEFTKVEFDFETEKLKLKALDFNSSSETVVKYGPEEVYRANMLIKEIKEQKEDAEENE